MYQDLIWDNNNQALSFRDDILNLHSLDDLKLQQLIENLEESELDNYMPISELIGIAFDENSVWGQLTIGELKCLSLLALGNLEEAKSFVEMFFTFNDNSPERKRFYQALDTIIEIQMNEDLELADYLPNMTRMFGEETISNALKTSTGELRFFGLTKTNNQLEGLEKHIKLIESYHKLQKAKNKL